MARTIPPDRFNHLVETATKMFIGRGYRLTQMADIAETLGVAKGTIYGYVESKEALFDASVRYADGHVDPPPLSEFPIRTPASGATMNYVRERLAAETAEMTLVQVVNRDLVIRDPRAELSAVLSDLYRRAARNRLALKLVDRCAVDYPELAKVWFGEGRWAQHQLLTELIKRRASTKRFRRLENPEIVARTILETIAFWAIHRHFDPSPQAVGDEDAERTVVDLLATGLLEKAREADS